MSSSEVRACAAKLDVELQSWRDRLLGSCSYCILNARYEKVRQGGLLLDCAVLITHSILPSPAGVAQKKGVFWIDFQHPADLFESELFPRGTVARIALKGAHVIDLKEAV